MMKARLQQLNKAILLAKSDSQLSQTSKHKRSKVQTQVPSPKRLVQHKRSGSQGSMRSYLNEDLDSSFIPDQLIKETIFLKQ